MTDPKADLIIRDLATQDDYLACLRLQDETWGSTFTERVPPAILRVSQKIGGVSAGAFDSSDRMIGFVFGMTGLRNGALVHWSDMLAVREGYRGKHIGLALKEYQRERVRAMGIATMLWTYDPLVAANAHFNINRLGARPIEYVPDMYGSNTGSALHGALPTDRFIVAWNLDPDANAESRGPSVTEAKVEVPPDFAALQINNPTEALRWRLRVREAMQSHWTRGSRVTGFVRAAGDQAPHYLLTRLEGSDPG